MSFQTTFAFDRDFQIGILALMLQDYEFMLTALELVLPEYFEDKALGWMFIAIRDYYLDYKVRPDTLVLDNEVQKAHAAGRIKDQDLGDYRALMMALGRTVDAKQYVIKEVVRFCRRQEVRRAFIDMAPRAESNDDKVWDEIVARVQGACSTGAHAIDIGTQYFLEYPERLRARMLGEEQLVIPTGISELDYKIGGGLKAGQLGVWMGGTGVGKSIALPHCGKRAVFGGYKVVHYTLELSEEDIAMRYDASWSAVPVYELRDRTNVVEDKLKKLHDRFGNTLIVKEYPTGTATVNTLRQHLQSLRNYKFVPDMVIVDYGDLLKSITQYDKAYDDLGAIFRDLRGLAGELKVPMWTATQVNRGGYSQEVADVDSIGDSFLKAQIADVVIAICATREEMENSELRLFLAKNRNGPSKQTVKITSAYDRMCFYRPVAAPSMSSAPVNVPQNVQQPPGLPPAPRRRPAKKATP